MKIRTLFLAFLLSCGTFLMHAYENEKELMLNQLIMNIAEGSNGTLVNQEDIVQILDLIAAGVELTENDTFLLQIFIEALHTEYSARLAQASTYENNLKTTGFVGFFASALLAIYFGSCELPHISNTFIDEQLHSTQNQSYFLIATALPIFYTLYKAQQYQNERIALEEVLESLTKLKEALW